jgi:hypothetical protein
MAARTTSSLLWLALVGAVLLCPRIVWAQATIIPTPAPTPLPVSVPTATPANYSAVRAFRCNCSSYGEPVIWAGNVEAIGYFQARQAAGGQCLAYLGLTPNSPYIASPAAGPLGGSNATATPNPFLTYPLDAAQNSGSYRPPVPGNNPCSNCACN